MEVAEVAEAEVEATVVEAVAEVAEAEVEVTVVEAVAEVVVVEMVGVAEMEDLELWLILYQDLVFQIFLIFLCI